MLYKILTNKWMHLFCCFVNSTFASISWNMGDYVWAVFAYALSFYCGWNFVKAIKEDYYDQDEQ